MSWESEFVSALAGVRLPNVFNPYAQRCELHDLPTAASIRRANLAWLLKQRYAAGVDAIWFGRDLGYRGGRRTGIALTDEAHLLHIAMSTDHCSPPAKATHGEVVRERTAAVIWSMIARLSTPPVLWNAFPLHPHQPDAPMTNRAHSISERKVTAWAIEALVSRFDRPRLIAIGQDASKALGDLGFEHVCVRHPSYGGQRDFVTAMERLHELAPVQSAQPLLC